MSEITKVVKTLEIIVADAKVAFDEYPRDPAKAFELLSGAFADAIELIRKMDAERLNKMPRPESDD